MYNQENTYNQENAKLKWLAYAGLAVLALILLQVIGFLVFDIVRVSERQVGVVTRFGQVQNVYTPGWHFKTPWIDSHTVTYDTGVQSVSAEAGSATKDQQTVKIKVNVQYRLDGSKARELYQTVKDQTYLNEAIIPPFIQEAVKASSSKYSATELLEKRDLVKTDVEEALQSRLKEYYSTVVAVNIENIDWSDQFDKSIEAKVIAEQDVQRKKQELEQAKIQAEIDLTKANAYAQQQAVIGKALRENPEALEKAKIEKWDGKLPQVQGNAGTIINLDEKK